MAYAKAFLPMMMFNAWASDLGTIVSDMAKAGRDCEKNPKNRRYIDDIALGFLMWIGGSLQSAMVGIGLAAVAIEKPEGDLGPKFVKLVKSGNILTPLRRNTLFHDPGANIFQMPRKPPPPNSNRRLKPSNRYSGARVKAAK
jgi:hypothetical protein